MILYGNMRGCGHGFCLAQPSFTRMLLSTLEQLYVLTKSVVCVCLLAQECHI